MFQPTNYFTTNPASIPPPSLHPPTPQPNRYVADSQVSSVMGKLRKFQGVLRDNGALRVGMDELLPGRKGRTLQVGRSLGLVGCLVF
jgi:hypothetical protein